MLHESILTVVVQKRNKKRRASGLLAACSAAVLGVQEEATKQPRYFTAPQREEGREPGGGGTSRTRPAMETERTDETAGAAVLCCETASTKISAARYQRNTFSPPHAVF